MNLSVPYALSDVPGIGGLLKQSSHDFVVEEIPAYEPIGEGEHTFLWIEKRDMTTQQLVRHIANVTGTAQRDIGTAGLKDRAAVARQYISIPAGNAEHVDAIQNDSVRLLHARRHGNKLRTGHLKGNKFSILVRDVCHDALSHARVVESHVQKHGFPNYFGEQRFGANSETFQTGVKLLRGTLRSGDLPRSQRRFLLRFSISAVQSMLFNAALRDRINDDLWQTVLSGDVMQVVETGGLFVVEDRNVEQDRFDVRETVVTGPIFGLKMKQPAGEVAGREEAILDEFEFGIDDFGKFPRLSRGARRPYVVWPADLSVEPEDDGLRFCFALPRGCYATTLLREFMRN